MTKASTLRPSERRLTEVAKKVVYPSGIVSTGWPALRDTCRSKLGVKFDGWQDGAGSLILGKRADGRLACMIGGAGMSLPRQAGKTFFLSGFTFGLCINMPGLLVIWSAHHARTHGETFLAMLGFADRAKVRPFIAQTFKGSGDEEIRFRNGSRILFGARERGFGRGIPGVDVLVMDEAQILSGKALEAMLPTMNTSQFGLALYVGTPPAEDADSQVRAEAFARMRSEAWSGDSTDLVWIECGADLNAELGDLNQWAKANPSFPHRTPAEAFLRLRKRLPSDDSFRREALGIWPSADDAAAIDLRRWASPALLDRTIAEPSRVSLVVDIEPHRRWSSIGVAGDSAGRTLVMCLWQRGTDWVAQKVSDLVAKGNVVDVAITPDQAKAIKPALTRAGVEDLAVLTRGDVGASCAAMQEAIKSGSVVHVGQAELDAAVANARTRYVGEVELWDRRSASVDISPLVACSAALYRWGLQKANYNVLESVW